MIQNLEAISLQSSTPLQLGNQNEQNKSKIRHYCFLVHGLWGDESEMSFIETALKDAIRHSPLVNNNELDHPLVEFVIHKTTCNNGNTNDGIANGGARLAQEIKTVLESPLRNTLFDQDENDPNTIKKTISFVGNSLGGLYARYAIANLYSDNTISPRNFNVFCTTG